MNSDGLIFDMDGVLVNSTEAHWRAWKRLGEEHGKPFPREVFEETFGMHNRQIIPKWLGDDLCDETNDRLSERKEELYRDLAAGVLQPLPGVVELVEAASEAGWKLAVGSSGPRANVELVLELLGLQSRFPALSTGDDVRHGKPHPEVFTIAIDRLGLPARRCVVIEDAPQGVEAGVASGARVLAVTSTRPASELAGAHRVVDSLADVDPVELRQWLHAWKQFHPESEEWRPPIGDDSDK